MLCRYLVDGEAHPMTGGPPTEDRYVCAWEAGALVTRSVGNTTFDQRRFMEGDTMVNELSFPAKDGAPSMTRRFVRQPSGAPS